MEQKYNKTSLGSEMQRLREYFEQEGEAVTFNKREMLERQGEPARWIAYVESGCFKYVTRSINDSKPHTTWFSFEGEFVADYPRFLYGSPAQSTIEAMMLSRVLRLSGESLRNYFAQNMETIVDLHCTTPRERYDMLMQRCPGIVNELPLNAIASFLNITPKTISMLRRDITYGKK